MEAKDQINGNSMKKKLKQCSFNETENSKKLASI
jgi:hypothetical protein